MPQNYDIFLNPTKNSILLLQFISMKRILFEAIQVSAKFINVRLVGHINLEQYSWYCSVNIFNWSITTQTGLSGEIIIKFNLTRYTKLQQQLRIHNINNSKWLKSDAIVEFSKSDQPLSWHVTHHFFVIRSNPVVNLNLSQRVHLMTRNALLIIVYNSTCLELFYSINGSTNLPVRKGLWCELLAQLNFPVTTVFLRVK